MSINRRVTIGARCCNCIWVACRAEIRTGRLVSSAKSAYTRAAPPLVPAKKLARRWGVSTAPVEFPTVLETSEGREEILHFTANHLNKKEYQAM